MNLALLLELITLEKGIMTVLMSLLLLTTNRYMCSLCYLSFVDIDVPDTEEF